MNVIMDLTKIDEVGERNELLGIESVFKEYICLHFVMAQYQQGGVGGGRVFHFAISEPAQPASQRSTFIYSFRLLTYIWECTIKSEPTQYCTEI
jgi:hypothetical protein